MALIYNSKMAPCRPDEQLSQIEHVSVNSRSDYFGLNEYSNFQSSLGIEKVISCSCHRLIFVFVFVRPICMLRKCGNWKGIFWVDLARVG